MEHLNSKTDTGMMTPAGRRFVKLFVAPIAAWVIGLVVIFAFPRDLPDTTGLAILAFPLVGFLLFIVFLVVFIVALVRRKRRLSPAIAILLIALIGGVYRARGLNWGSRFHLFVNHNRYELTISKLRTAHSREEKEAICGDGCLIVSDEPLRVAFHTCHSFLYWPDIVYDLTGAVSDTDISRLHQLNVYLFGADRLTGDWYLGNFGD